MMGLFWLGVAAVPVSAVGMTLAWAAIGRLIALAGRFPVTLVRVTPDTTELRRSALGATVYAAKRSWLVAFGDTCIAISVGLDDSRNRAEARQRLEVLRTVKLKAKETADA